MTEIDGKIRALDREPSLTCTYHEIIKRKKLPLISTHPIMIILKGIKCTYLQSVQVELPRANMVIDPRPNEPYIFSGRFRCDYHDNGTTVTLTRTEGNTPWDKSFEFRVYDPSTETVPSFDSTIYTYMGVDGERAPRETTLLIIDPSVRVIKKSAFSRCDINKCYMHDGVHTIEGRAFQWCIDMKVIRLSQTLTHIGPWVFYHCYSLEAIFLPPSINRIDRFAFYVSGIRIFPLPLNIDISHLGASILDSDSPFFEITQIQPHGRQGYDDYKRMHREIINFYRDQIPPLHKAALHTHVTRQTIQQCIDTHGQAAASITDHDGMTPLHILAMNPHADTSAIFACFHVNMSGAFVGDRRGNTPLDYLRVHRASIKDHTSLVCHLCMHRVAAAGSSQYHQETSMKKKR